MPGPLSNLPPTADRLPPGLVPDQVESLMQPGTELGEPPVDGHWFPPFAWFTRRYWDSRFQFGLNGNRGNSDILSFQSGFQLSRETDTTNWDVSLNYAQTESMGIKTQQNALFNSDWDKKLSWDKWSTFIKLGLEYDEFRNFDLRLNANTGLGYMIVNDGTNNQLRARVGSGFSQEYGGPDDSVQPEAVFGFDLARQLTSRQKLSWVFDYFPTWNDFSNYRIVSDAGWEVLLDEESNLSFKISVIDRYDSTPQGLRPNDVNYAVLLIWSL